MTIYLFWKEIKLPISYNKLWKLLIDRKMSKAELRKLSGISPNTMTKLTRDEEVAMAILCRICDVLHADIGDIIEYRTCELKDFPNEKE